jgi:hypothetical protein
MLVAVDKFTKWIEAKPIKKLDGSSTIKFFNEIITRYGVPHSIITDNGTNFAKGVFAKGIRLDLASVAHPQSNGQVEKSSVGRRVALSTLELAHHSKLLCQLHAFLPGLRSRSDAAH